MSNITAPFDGILIRAMKAIKLRSVCSEQRSSRNIKHEDRMNCYYRAREGLGAESGHSV
jgi:hypothetical protein